MKNKDFVSSKFIYILVSLFFAIVLFFNANAVLLKNSNDRTNASETHSTTLYDVPIELKYDHDKYFVSGFDGSANVYLTSYNLVRLNAEKSSDTRSFHLVVDLTKVKEGTVEVPVRVVELATGVNAQVDPGNISVTVEKKAEKTFDITPVVSLKLLPEGYQQKNVSHDKDTVKVTSGASIITQIDKVQAVLPSDVILDNDYSGKVYLQAIDKSGKVLPAKLSPTSVNMKVAVELPNKHVPIVGKITGKKDNSFTNYNFKLSKDTANISGEQKFIDDVSSITANIDVTNITKETTIKVPLSQDNVTISPNVIDVTVTPVKK
ncbi:MAG: CdaR family protein [Pseudolactococcus laudensis]|uniref:CdaR family protein n=1 Tax=Pseudolactococcus laudensis TaxID=1494461 RepID=UPI003F943E4C